MKTFVCQVAHPGSLESLTVMVRAIGGECLFVGPKLADELRRLGCDTVVSPHGLAETFGTTLAFSYREATLRDMLRKDVVYVDIKAHRNGPKVWKRWPNLRKRTLWYRINGGRPCNVPGKGNELDPPCPVLTADPWYDIRKPWNRGDLLGVEGCLPLSTLQRSYSRWPPFARREMFSGAREVYPSLPPVCLVHNLKGWGYGDVGDALRRRAGMKGYGGWGSPDGPYRHDDLPDLLSRSLAMVHLKGQDCPGYSLYEAMTAGCPVIVSNMMIGWCKMGEVFEHGKTCLTFDRAETVTGGTVPTPVDAHACIEEILEHLKDLTDPLRNRELGEWGRDRINAVRWSPAHIPDVLSLSTFIKEMFG